MKSEGNNTGFNTKLHKRGVAAQVERHWEQGSANEDNQTVDGQSQNTGSSSEQEVESDNKTQEDITTSLQVLFGKDQQIIGFMPWQHSKSNFKR